MNDQNVSRRVSDRNLTLVTIFVVIVLTAILVAMFAGFLRIMIFMAMGPTDIFGSFLS